MLEGSARPHIHRSNHQALLVPQKVYAFLDEKLVDQSLKSLANVAMKERAAV